MLKRHVLQLVLFPPYLEHVKFALKYSIFTLAEKNKH